MLNLEPIKCVVIEDAPSGIAAAHAAGVRIIVAVGHGDQLKSLGKLPGVTKTIHDFSEIHVSDLFT